MTNHLLSEYRDPEKRIEPFPGGSFNQYCRLQDAVANHEGKLSLSELRNTSHEPMDTAVGFGQSMLF